MYKLTKHIWGKDYTKAVITVGILNWCIVVGMYASMFLVPVVELNYLYSRFLEIYAGYSYIPPAVCIILTGKIKQEYQIASFVGNAIYIILYILVATFFNTFH